MEETLKKKSSGAIEPAEKTVTLRLRSNVVLLNGLWEWEMESTAVYCSDVMHFPAGFEGTRGIVHPDDLPKLSSALELLADGELAHLHFRLITTWGDVKRLDGTRVTRETLRPDENFDVQSRQESLAQLALRREAEFLKLRTDLANAAEKLHRIGSWAVNKSTGEAWYSDGIYRLHNLAPQSLNAHANTFHIFLHPDDRTAVIDALETAYAQEVPVHLEYRIQLTDGAVLTLRLVTHWSYNEKGQPVFSGVLRDLSEERQLSDEAERATQSIKLHQQVLRFSESYSNTGHWFVNLITRKTTYSDNYYRIYGLRQQQLPSYNSFLNLVHPDDRPLVHDLINRMYTEHQLPEAEFRILRPDGKQRQLRQTGKAFISGGDLLMIGTVQDVTVLRGLEKKMAELHDKAALQDLVQAVTEKLTETAFISWLPEGHIHWSEGFYRLLGYKPGSVEPLQRTLHRQIHPDDLKAFKEAESLVTNGQSHEGLKFRVLNRGGLRQLSLTFHRVASHNREIVVGLVQDFTKEIALHQKLAETTRFGETLSAAISDIVLLTDRENTVLAWNRAASEKTGIKAEDALYGNLFDLFPALNEESYLKQLQTVMQGTEVRQLKVRSRYLQKPHNYYLVPLLNETNDLTRVLHVVQDVSRELDLQQQLSERLAFIENLVESSVDRIVVLDKHMNYVYWNKKAEEYYAISKARVIGRNILEVFPGLRSDPSYNEFRKVLRGETVYLPPTLSDESTEYFETYLIPIKNDGGEVSAILWIVHDLAKELALQQEQRRAQKQLAEEHRRLKEAQAIGHVGSFEWTVGSPEVNWSEELYRINDIDPQSEEASLQTSLDAIHPDDKDELEEKKLLSLTQPGHHQHVHRIVSRAGAVKWVHHRWESIANEAGEVVRVSGIVQDITEKKEAEEEVRRQQELLQATMNSTLDMIQVFEAVRNENGEIVDFRYVLLNHEAEKWMPDAVGKRLLQVQPGVVREGIFDAFKEVVETGVPQQYEKHYAHEQFNGWFHQSVVKLNDGVATTTTNITARKKAEEELLHLKDKVAQQATDKYYSLFNSIDEGFHIIELIYDEKGKAVDYRFLETNQSFERHTGLKNAVGKLGSEIAPGTEDVWFKAYDKVVRNGEPLRFEDYNAFTGRWYSAFAFGVSDENPLQVAVLFSDITERKQEEKQQAFLLSFTDAVRNLADPNQIQVAVCQRLGIELEADRVNYAEVQDDEYVVANEFRIEGLPSMKGRYPIDSFRQEEIAAFRQGQTVVVADILAEPGVSKTIADAYLSINVRAFVSVPLVKSGKLVVVLSVIKRQPHQWGKPEVSLIEDAAERTWAAVERAKAEQALVQSEEKYRTLFNSVDEGFLIHEMIRDETDQAIDFRLMEVNPAFTRQTGLGIETVGMRASEFLPNLERFWIDLYDRVARTGISERAENYNQATNRWYNVHVSKVSGHDRRVAVVFEDITERKRFEIQLKENYEQIQLATKAANAGWGYRNFITGEAYWDEQGKKILGFPNEEDSHTVEGWQKRIHPEDLPGVEALMADCINENKPFDTEYRIVRADGETHFVHAMGTFSKSDDGALWKGGGLVMDITERKQREERQGFLLRLNDALRPLVDPVEIQRVAMGLLGEHLQADRVIYADINLDEDYFEATDNYASKATQKITGRFPFAAFGPPGEKLKRGETLIIHDVSAEVGDDSKAAFFSIDVHAVVAAPLVKQGKLVADLTVHQTKPRHWLAHEIALVQETAERTWEAVERGKAEEALRHREQELARVQEIGNIGGVDVDLLNNLPSERSPEYLRIHGLPPETRAETHADWLRRVHPDDRERAEQTMLKALQSAQPTYESEYRIVRPSDGQVRWIYARLDIERNADGKAVRLVGVHIDVTQRKLVEEALRQSEEHYRYKLEEDVRLRTQEWQHSNDLLKRIYNNISIGISVLQPIRAANGSIEDFEISITNAALNKETGRTDLVGKRYAEEYPGIREVGIFDLAVKAYETGERQLLEYFYPYEGFNKWFFCQFIKTGNAVLATNEDITPRKNAEEQIQKNFTILKQAEDIAAIGSWEYQIPSGRFSWSDGMYNLFDYPRGIPVRPEEYADRALEEDRATAKRIVKALRKTHEPFEETLRIQRKDGVRLLKVKGSVVTDEAGKPLKMVGVDMDITELKDAQEKLHESRRWLAQTTEASPDAITVYDLQKKQPVYLNNCLAEWMGIPKDELVNMGIDGRLRLVHPDDRLRLLHFNEMLTTASDKEIRTLEYRLTAQDGRLVWLRNRARVFQRDANGRVTHILSILQDVTDEKEAETQLNALYAALEKKNKDLESKNEEITSFAFVASHDLKEPLRKIHTFSDWLLTKEEGISKVGRENLNRLRSSVKRMDMLVDDVVALTKMHVDDRGEEAVSLNEVLRRALYEMQEDIDQAGAEIYSEELPALSGSENHLVYLFKNLLSNALKFQPPGNRPVVRIHCSKENDAFLISFSDNGIGFAPEHRKKIFQMFRRLHGRSEYEGTGMGLAICKKIMEKHGGNISAQSEPGKGAVFTCCFPVGGSNAPQHATPDDSSR